MKSQQNRIELVTRPAIGQRQAEKALLDGTLFKPSEALAINLIDEVGEDAEDTLAKCRTHLARLGNNRSDY